MSDKSNYTFNLKFNIENWKPKIIIPSYDKLFSLEKFLERKGLKTEIITRIMSSKNPFGEAKNIYSYVDISSLNNHFIYSHMIEINKNWTIIFALRDVDPLVTFENTFIHLVYEIARIADWDMKNGKSFYYDSLISFLSSCEKNDYKSILNRFDMDILSCFALAHLKSNMNLIEILDIGFKHIELNCKSCGTPHGNFYNIFGKENIEGIIKKVFESAYIINKFSLRSLFFKKDKFATVEKSSMKYDILQMENEGNAYFPNENDKPKIISDVLFINVFLNKVKLLANSFPAIFIEDKDILFRTKNSNPNSRMYCVFIYEPNTDTGKAYKYPLRLNFFTKKEINGTIEYLQNMEIGKMRISVFCKDDSFHIQCINKNNELIISKIEYNNSFGKKELYNVNKK